MARGKFWLDWEEVPHTAGLARVFRSHTLGRLALAGMVVSGFLTVWFQPADYVFWPMAALLATHVIVGHRLLWSARTARGAAWST